jgi:hypothetical protein
MRTQNSMNLISNGKIFNLIGELFFNFRSFHGSCAEMTGGNFAGLPRIMKLFCANQNFSDK